MVEPSAVRASGLHPRRLALAILVLGAAIVALALPQFMAALARTGGDPVIAAIAQGERVSDIRLERALASRSTAVNWWPLPRDLGDIALLQTLQARAMDPARQAGQRRLMLDRAAAAARSALAQGAADPFLWMRLAEAGFLRDGLQPKVAVPLMQSMRLGPTLQSLILPRLELAFILYPTLTDPQREELYRQVRLAALWQPEWLVAHARARHALGIVRRGLAATPERLETFDLAWERSRQSP